MLKSSIEYAFAYYLDYKNMNWKYEQESYDIDGNRYTPDFFLYDDNDNLNCIVEVRGDRRRIKDGTDKVKYMKTIYNIRTVLLTERMLRDKYLTVPFSFDAITDIWKQSDETVFNMGMSGEYNPNYGNTYSEESKRKISEKSKERWKNKEFREKMLIIIRKNAAIAGQKMRGRIKSPRESRICLYCKNEFVVTIYSRRKYCSSRCVCLSNSSEAAKVNSGNRKKIRDDIKKYALKWAITHNEIIKNTPHNRILTNLKDMYDNICKQFNVKDWRIISKSITESSESRKDMLDFLKSYVSNL